MTPSSNAMAVAWCTSSPWSTSKDEVLRGPWSLTRLMSSVPARRRGVLLAAITDKFVADPYDSLMLSEVIRR
jgi:hypothetical protein